MLRRVRLNVGWLHAKRSHIVVVGFGKTCGDLTDGLATLSRGRDDLVIHIRDIARKRQLVTAPQEARQQVEHNRRPCIADMRVVVNRRATQVHRHLAFLKRNKGDFLALKCIV